MLFVKKKPPVPVEPGPLPLPPADHGLNAASGNSSSSSGAIVPYVPFVAPEPIQDGAAKDFLGMQSPPAAVAPPSPPPTKRAKLADTPFQDDVPPPHAVVQPIMGTQQQELAAKKSVWEIVRMVCFHADDMCVFASSPSLPTVRVLVSAVATNAPSGNLDQCSEGAHSKHPVCT